VHGADVTEAAAAAFICASASSMAHTTPGPLVDFCHAPTLPIIEFSWNFTSQSTIMQVEHTADCFGGAWFKSPLSTEV